MLKSLYPDDNRPPFIIVAPRYVRTSAGIKALHLVCHWLNRLGYNAYLHIDPPWYGNPFSLELITPRLTREIVDQCNIRQLNPIIFIPETIHKNPFGDGGITARFVGNYPGLLGGPKIFGARELIIPYSQRIADEIGSYFDVLYVPTVDTRIFNREFTVSVRSGACAYLGKYRDVHNGAPFGLPPDTVIFGRDDISGLTPIEIRELFYSKEFFYAFEDTALSLEAALCGCIPILMLNKHFQKPLGLSELNYFGHALGSDPKDVEQARLTLAEVSRIYQRIILDFPDRLQEVAERLIVESRKKPYKKPIIYPKETRGVLVYNGRPVSVYSIAEYIKLRGWRHFLKRLVKITRFSIK